MVLDKIINQQKVKARHNLTSSLTRWPVMILVRARPSLLGHSSVSPGGLMIWATWSGPAPQVKVLQGEKIRSHGVPQS